MAQVYLSDKRKRTTPLAGGGPYSLRGHFHPEDGQAITITQQYGPRLEANGLQLVFSAHLWPGGALVAFVTRAWKSGSFGKAWAEMRRQLEA